MASADEDRRAELLRSWEDLEMQQRSLADKIRSTASPSIARDVIGHTAMPEQSKLFKRVLEVEAELSVVQVHPLRCVCAPTAASCRAASTPQKTKTTAQRWRNGKAN